jgi:hypothetical protein
VQFVALLFHLPVAILAAMTESTPPPAIAAPAELLPPETALAVADGALDKKGREMSRPVKFWGDGE